MNEKLNTLVKATQQDQKKGSFFFAAKRVTEIPISDKPSPYKLHYCDKNPKYFVISP
jgi:hypothetical protein